MASMRQWWRFAAGAAKDKRSLLVARLQPRGARHPELEAAVIRATSHDDQSVDYRSAALVFAWARTSPSLVRPIMWALARRARRTRCWAVALKALILAHGLLLHSSHATPTVRLGRVPFDLADFRDRSAPPSKSPGLSAFVRAYFRFLDYRSLFAVQEGLDSDDPHSDDVRLDRTSKLQILLDLLMQIRPYSNGMEVGLVLETMDCVLIEIFEVHSEICTGIARFLVGFLGSAPATSKPRPGKTAAAAWVKILRKAAEQSAQLSSYFELCGRLGVLNARKFPDVERVPEEDLWDLEKLLVGNVQDNTKEVEVAAEEKALVVAEDTCVVSNKVVTTGWVMFDEDNAGTAGREGHFGNYGNPFVAAPWEICGGGNLIELF